MTHKKDESTQENVESPVNGDVEPAGNEAENSELSELDSLKQELEAKQNELDELRDKLLRNQAENENFQKRMRKEQAEFARFAAEGLINSLLPVMDDLERAIEAAEQSKDVDSLANGVKLILDQLKGVLEKAGVADVQAKGEQFDPAHHEAVHMVETDEHDDNAVIDELRKGYKLNERILRPAMVSVAKKKSK